MLIHLIIAAVVAVVVSGFYQGYQSEDGSIYVIDPVTMCSFIVATVVTVLLGKIGSMTGSSQPGSSRRSAAPAQALADADREEGTVKWFNVSKGFGFIIRGSGEEIFVHYRSIRGHGRRRLFDGQTVSFIIIDSDKGLQADDVEVIK